MWGSHSSLGAKVFLYNYTLISLNVSLKMDVNSEVQTWEGQSKYARQNSNNLKQTIAERTGMVAFLVMHATTLILIISCQNGSPTLRLRNQRVRSDWQKIILRKHGMGNLQLPY